MSGTREIVRAVLYRLQTAQVTSGPITTEWVRQGVTAAGSVDEALRLLTRRGIVRHDPDGLGWEFTEKGGQRFGLTVTLPWEGAA